MRSSAHTLPSLHHRPRLRRALLAVAVAVTLVTATIAATVTARAAVPPTPSGWSLVWSDDFNGAANTLPSSANWIIDIGTSYPGGPANWGTGEIQTYTNSTANVSLDGAGNLRITPLRDGAGQLDLGAHRDQRTNFKAAGRRHAAHRGPHPDAERHRRRGRSATGRRSGRSARRTGATTGTGRASASSTSWRTSTGSTRSGACCTAASNPGGPCNETNGIGASRACPGAHLPVGVPHLPLRVGHAASTRNQLRWYVDGQQYHTVTPDARSASRTGPT